MLSQSKMAARHRLDYRSNMAAAAVRILGPSSHQFVVGVASPLRRCVQFDHVVDAQDGDGSLRRKLQTLYLRYRRLEDARLLVVPDDALVQVKADPETKVGCQRREAVARKQPFSVLRCDDVRTPGTSQQNADN